jgi:hypothetical protein
MQVYSDGHGHVDLAQRLSIDNAFSLAIGGSANTRVIRTTLKDSFMHNNEPTLYILGIGFLSRWEVPILNDADQFEGRWTNPQNQDYRDRWEHYWKESDTKKLIELKLKSDLYSIKDRVEDLMYQLVAMVSSLQSRGHRVLCYQQADKLYNEYVKQLEPNLFKDNSVFIDELCWRAVSWQIEQGVPTNEQIDSRYEVPNDIRHPAAGHHQLLNSFLVDYINKHNILQ